MRLTRRLSSGHVAGVLSLAFRLALGRQDQQRWRRVALITAGVVSASLIILGFAVASVLQSVERREFQRTGVLGEPGRASLLIVNRADSSGGMQFPVIFLEPGPHAVATPVLPPGLSRMPEPGTAVISPRLAALAAADPGLAHRYPPTSPTIAQTALARPDELLAYVRPPAGRSFAPSDPVFHLTGYGADPHSAGTVSVGAPLQLPTMQMLLGAAALLGIPVILLVCAAAATASPTRDRRLQVLRRMGMSAGNALLIVIVDTLIGFGIGAVAAGAVWFALLPMLGHIPLLGLPVLAGDLAVGPGMALAAAFIAVGIGVVSAIVTDRWRTIATGPRPAAGIVTREALPAWRYLPAATGILLVLGSFVVRGRAGGTLALSGIVTMILSLPLLAAHSIAAAGAFLRQLSPPPMLLAGRRLEREPAQSARPLMGVAALSLILGSAAGFLAVVRAPDQPATREPAMAVYRLSSLDPRPSDFARLQQRLPSAAVLGYDADPRTGTLLVDGDCAPIVSVLGVPCADGRDLVVGGDEAKGLRRLLGLAGEGGEVRIRGGRGAPRRAVLVIARVAEVSESAVRNAAWDTLLAPVVGDLAPGDRRESPLVAWILAAMLAAGILAGLAALILTIDGGLRSAHRHSMLRALGLTSGQLAWLEAWQFSVAYTIVVGSSLAVGVVLCAAVTVIGGLVPMPWPLLGKLIVGVVASGAASTLLIYLFARREEYHPAESMGRTYPG